jgi:ubiquinone/menaquinone biosynthesis C-methylase UbiE
MADTIHSRQKGGAWDEYWSDRSIERELAFCQTDELLPVFRRYLSKDALILEAGCGIGKWVLYFQRYGFKIIGVDSNQGCLLKIKQCDSKASVINGMVETLPFKDKSLDIYISLGVIEHFKDGPIQALREARRVLKPDGTAIIEVPYFNLIRHFIFPFKIIYRWVRKILRREPKDYYFAEFRYTRKELKDFLEEAGFEVLGIAPKDDIQPDRNIGLWLDFPFVRAKDKDDVAHKLNGFGCFLSSCLRAISPWISCACVVCIGSPNK